MSRAWILNFDVEEEMEDPSRTTRTAALARRVHDLAARVGSLLGPGDVVVDAAAGAAVRNGRGYAGRAWCPTPRALAALERSGAEPPMAPRLDVLRRTNHRAFSAELGQTLPGGRYVRSWTELEDALSATPTDSWLLKRAFGFAGRGRRRVRSEEARGVARTWIEASLRAEGLQVEPWVERCGDFGLHGFLDRDGVVYLGEPTEQEVDETGAWLRSSRAEPRALSPEERVTLVAEAERTAGALRDGGYFGPFGIDAYRWRTNAGELAWNPRSEINARYSMGWAVGMGELRPDL